MALVLTKEVDTLRVCLEPLLVAHLVSPVCTASLGKKILANIGEPKRLSYASKVQLRAPVGS